MTTVHVRGTDGGLDVRGPTTFAAGIRLPSGGGVHAGWSADDGTLTVRNDALGFFPLFYRTLPDAIVVGDDIGELLRTGGGGVELDHEMAAVMLEFGQLVGERTLFTGVRTLPPGSVLRWDGRGAEISRVATDPGPDEPPRTRREGIDRYIALFRTAVERRLTETHDVAMLLSGGEDSRHILLELCRQGAPPDVTVTAAAGGWDPDLRAARALTEHVGVPMRRTTHRLTDLMLESEANRRTSYCANELAWMLPTVERVASTANASYDGIGGDVLSAGLFLTPHRVELARRGEWLEVIRDLCGGDDAARLHERFVPRSVTRDLPPREETLRQLAGDLAGHAGSPNPIGSWMFATRTRRHMTMQPHALLAGLEVHTPYLDLDLVAFLRSLPDRWLVDRRFHRDAILRAYPRSAPIPFANALEGPVVQARLGARRRAEALRLTVQAAEAWPSSLVSRLVAIPRIRFTSFLAVRRAITVHQAATLCRDLSG